MTEKSRIILRLKMDRKRTSCIVYSLSRTFVIKDINYLKKIGHKVFEIKSSPKKNIFLFLINRINQFFKSLIVLSKSDSVFIWFSDYHSFIPLFVSKFFSVKSIIIVGGYDAISDREIGHGIFVKKGFRQTIAKLNYYLSSEIWVVDRSLSEGCKVAFEQNKIKSGLINWMPDLKKKIQITPTGYSSDFWRRTKEKKPNTILTVANIDHSRIIKIKGISLIFNLAKQVPEFKFQIIGLENKSLVETYDKPKNVKFIKPKKDQDLRDYYSESQYYIQPSRLEGLPNALCEAMLCECIPIGNKVFGIPNAIGTTGLLFDGPHEIKKIVVFLRANKKINSNQARRRIINLFNEEKRMDALRKV